MQLANYLRKHNRVDENECWQTTIRRSYNIIQVISIIALVNKFENFVVFLTRKTQVVLLREIMNTSVPYLPLMGSCVKKMYP